MMTGAMPEEHIDHINGIRDDNRWENLRPVNRATNQKNMKLFANNTSGVPGVRKSPNGLKWVSRIFTEGKEVHLGTFKNKEDAVAARKKAEIDYGVHANHGRS